MKRTKIKPTIVGRFFHSFDKDHSIKWQGQVIAEQNPGVYLVQLYDWIVGAPGCTKLVRVDRMLDEGWDFYEKEDRDSWSYEGNRLSEAAYRKQQIKR